MPTAFNEQTGELLVLDSSGKWTKPTVAKNPQTGETLYHDGSDWKPIPLDKKEAARGGAVSLANGLLMGYGDETIAAINNPLSAVRAALGAEPQTGGYYTDLMLARRDESRFRSQRPGQSIGLNLLGAVPTAIATGGAAGAGVRTVAPQLGRIGQAAGIGALYGGVSGYGSGEGGVANRIESGALGAGTGAVIGGALEGVVNPIASRFVQWVRGNPQMFDPQTLTLTVEGQQAAQRAGLNPQEASTALQQEFAAQARNAINPADALATAEARTLPVPMTLTRGQATLSPEQQMFESQAAKDVFGQLAGNTMRASQEAQQQGLRANAAAIQQRIGGGTVQESGQGVAAARQQIVNAEQALRARTNQLYEAAREANGNAFILGHNVGEGLATIQQDLQRQGWNATTAPRVHDLLTQAATNLRDLGRSVGGNPNVSVGNLFEIRQQLSALSRSTDGVTGPAAGHARRALDRMLNDAIDQDLIAGDPAVVELWRRAIASRREMAVRFQGGDLIEKLVERNGGNLKLDPVGAMNLIFGQSNTGFVSKSGMLNGLQRLRSELGANSQAWNSLREEAFLRLGRSGEGATQPLGRDFSGANFAKAWETMQQKSPEVVRILFSQEERNLISQFARVARRVTTNVRGGNNSSDTSAGVAQLVKRMWSSAFMGPRAAAIFDSLPLVRGLQNVGADMRVTASVRGGFPTGPQPAQPLNSVTRSVAPLAATGGQRANR